MGHLISLSTMRRVEIPDCAVGQIVKYTGDMANASGIGAVVAIRNGSFGKTYDVALSDGREFLASMLQSDRWQISAQIAEREHLDILRAGVEAKKATDAANKTAAAQTFAQAKERIKKENPHLIAVKDGEYSSYVLAAKNIRIELKRAFPGVKFSVRCQSYSGGNSIDIEWTDGPNDDQVSKITDKYSGGTFDGMTDCYNYSHSPWTEVFGEGKYVHTNRHYSDAMVASRIRYVVNHLGGIDPVPTVKDYKQGRIWQFKQDGGCDVQRELNRALHKHTYCIEKVQP